MNIYPCGMPAGTSGDKVSIDPSAPTSPWAARLAPSRIVAFAVFAAIPVKLLARRLEDPDLWWHLKTGALIVRNHAIPAVDPYSYTAPGKPWIVQEWLSEVILYGIHKAFGLYGILFYRAIVVLIVYVLVARLLVRRMGSGMGTWALLGLTAFAGAINWTERPNLLSFLLFVVTLTLLERRDRWIWWFLPLAVLWSNLHGMVVLGIGLVALVALVEWLKILARWPGADRTWAMRLGLVSLTGIGAAFLNPYGPGLFVHAFRLIRLVQNFVGEWASPDFHQSGQIVFMVLVLVTVAVLAFNPERPDATDIALVLAFTVLALQAARNLAVAAIVLGVVCARYLPGALSVLPRRPSQRKDVGESSSVLLGVMGLFVVLIGLGVVLAAGFPHSSQPKDIVDKKFPIAAVRALDRPGVRLFVQDGWSGLAIYYDCGPVPTIEQGCQHARVFVDLRWDFYGAKLSDEYDAIHNAGPDWKKDLNSSCTTDVLVTPGAPITQVLALDPDWQLIQQDKLSVTYHRTKPFVGCPQLS